MGNTELNFVLNFPDHPGVRISGLRIGGLRMTGFRISGFRITEGPLYKGYQFHASLWQNSLFCFNTTFGTKRWENDINAFKICGPVAIPVSELMCDVITWRVRATAVATKTQHCVPSALWSSYETFPAAVITSLALRVKIPFIFFPILITFWSFSNFNYILEFFEF